MKGKFIVIEGLDGAGISTQSALLAHYLKDMGLHPFLTKEPTNGMLGGLIKSALREEWTTSPKAMQLLFCADRAHHLDNEITPMISRGKIVICDRYIFSTMAYGFASNVNYKWLRQLNLSFRLPDLGIFIDVNPSTTMVRTSDEGAGLQLFDEKQKLMKVRQAYLHIAKEFHLKVVNGNNPIDEVSAQINKIVEKYLKK